MNSKSLISLLWLSTVLVACSSKENQNTVEVRKVMDDVEGDVEGVFLIHLSDSVSVHWDNSARHLVNDTLLSRATTSYSGKKQSIIDRISDTTETPARICTTERKLAIGDIAFLLIDEIENVPYAYAFDSQFDFFEQDCRYPHGLFDYIDGNREEVRSKVEWYLSHKTTGENL